MKLDISEMITNLAGVPLKWGEDTKDPQGNVTTQAPAMTLGDVLLSTATCNPPEKKPYTQRQQVLRWRLAERLYKVKGNPNVSQKIDIPMIELRVIGDDIARIWNTTIAGQTLKLLGVKAPD